MEERNNVSKRSADELKKCIEFQSETIKKIVKMLKEKNKIISKKEKEILSLKFKIKTYERELKILRGKINDAEKS